MIIASFYKNNYSLFFLIIFGSSKILTKNKISGTKNFRSNDNCFSEQTYKLLKVS